MFKYAPENLPCAQHDCFALEREKTSALIRKNPALLTMMVIGAIDSQNVKVMAPLPAGADLETEVEP